MESVRVPQSLLDLAMSPRRQPRNNVWITGSGVIVTGDGRYGVPFGRTRVILLFLAAKAAEMGSVIDGRLDEIADMFQLGWRHETLQMHFMRCIRCNVSRVDTMDPANACCEQHLFGTERVDLFETAHYCEQTRRFRVVCSQWFVEQARDAILCPLDTVRTIIWAERFAVLDLYAWYQWKLAGKDYGTVNAFGPAGPCHFLSIPGPTGKRHQTLIEWHRGVVKYWPECPFRVVGNGRYIECDARNENAGSTQSQDQPIARAPAAPESNSAQRTGTRVARKTPKTPKTPTQGDAAPSALQSIRATTPVSNSSKPSSPRKPAPTQRLTTNPGERRPAPGDRGAVRKVLVGPARRDRTGSTQTVRRVSRATFPPPLPPVPKIPQLRTPEDVRKAADVVRESVRSISRALRALGSNDSPRGPPDVTGT